MSDMTPPGPSPLDAERQRLRAQGYSDSEISQILVARALGGSAGPSGSVTPPQGALSNVISSIVAAATYAAGLFTTIRHDIGTILDRSASTGARTSAFAVVAIKAVVIGALAFAAWQEWQQHIISQTQIAAAQAKKVQAEADAAKTIADAQAEKLKQEAAVAKELNEAQARKLDAEAGAAKEVAAGAKAQSCQQRLELMTKNMYMEDMNPNGSVKPGTATARMFEKYQRECGGITGETQAAVDPAVDPVKAKACSDKFDALFTRLQQANRTDTATIDKIGIEIFRHRQDCPLTDDQMAKLDTMRDVVDASNERIKTAATAALTLKLGEQAITDFAAGHYEAAYDNEKKSAQYAEEFETKSKGHPAALTAGTLASVSWRALFARDYQGAITAADRAIEINPPNLVALTNKAHALMFLGRTDEAKTLYLAHRGEKIDDKREWSAAVAGDFVELRKAGLTNPLMDDVTRELSKADVAPPPTPEPTPSASPTPSPAASATPEPSPTLTPLRTPTMFNCAKASMGADYVICASPELMDAEARLEDIYNAARKAKGDSVRSDQIDWIKRYGADCGLPIRGRPSDIQITSAADCVKSAIEKRIRELRDKITPPLL